MKPFKPLFYLLIFMMPLSSCLLFPPQRTGALRSFTTSFESEADFSGFYIVPQNYMNSSNHELTNSLVHSGTYSHHAWIYAANPPSDVFTNNNHRGYPTVQFNKTAQGPLITPCLITLWVYLTMNLQPRSGEDDWFSFATFTDDSSDSWNRTVLVNLNYQGHVHLMHVPFQGQQTHLFQTSSITFPMNQWVKLTIYLDLNPDRGYAKVWQDGQLVSHAEVRGAYWQLAQAHFGLYAPPQMTSGEVYNDDLVIVEVDNEPVF
ncbi:MAG: hypothetical protein JXR70_04865 [Spirochaetales bacterium]|nr:hypothetical protein [Spirochaetales bacterium]